MGLEVAQAAAKKTAPEAMVPNTSTMLKKAIQAAPKIRHRSAPIVKRSVLLSLGKANPSISEISNNLQASGYANPEVEDTSDATSFAIGFRQPIGRYWSVDATYIDQGEAAATVKAVPSGSNPAADVAKSLPIYASGLNYVGLRHFPVGHGMNAHAGAGIFIYSGERKATIDGVNYVDKDKGVKPMAQLGLSYAATPRVNLELTAQRFFMDGEDVDRLSIGVAVGF